MSDDLFGLESVLKIKKSGVRNVFTPHTPINRFDHFFGREKDVKRMISLIDSPGQHILLYGDRGVGKTSLAKTTCSFILNKINKGLFFTKSCDSEDIFSSLFIEPLKHIGCDTSVESITKSLKQTGDASLNVVVAKGGLQSERQSSTVFKNPANLNSPSWIANRLKDLDCIFLLDEVDTLVNVEDKHKLAELIKALSDLNSPFKIILVGIAKTASDLTAGHRSVQRCLKEIRLERMDDEDIRKIILNGMKQIEKRPIDEVVDKIVNISSGFPHFAHLICLKCAEIAIETNKTHIENEILDMALDYAATDSEGTLTESVDAILRTINKPQDYKLLLLAAANCQKRDFRSSEVTSKFKELFNIDITSAKLSKRLSKLTNEDVSHSILIKTGRGCFSFQDPRMPSFIKISFNNSRILAA